MKIAYLFADHNHSVVRDAGDSVHIQEMCRALDHAGHSVFVVAAERGNSSEPLTELAVRETGRPAVGELPLRIRGVLRSQSADRRYVADGVAEPSWAPGAVARDASRLGWAAVWNAWFYRRARSVIAQERPDALYERYVPFGIAGSRLAATFGLPLVVEMNTSFAFPTEAWYRRSPLYTGVTRWAERYLAGHTDRIAAVSATMREYLISVGARPERVSVVANAADPRVFRPDPVARSEVRRAFELDEDCIVVGFVGSLKRWHGVDVLLDAAKTVLSRCSRFRFVIVGDGPVRQELMRQVERAGLENSVIFAGTVDRDRAARYLSAFDIAVVPAPALPTFYFSPLKIFEYMATGTAVVAARYPELQTIADEGRTALLFSPGDADGLADALARLGADEHLRAELGRRGREAIEEKHTWDHRAASVSRLYDEIDHDRQSNGAARRASGRASQ